MTTGCLAEPVLANRSCPASAIGVPFLPVRKSAADTVSEGIEQNASRATCASAFSQINDKNNAPARARTKFMTTPKPISTKNATKHSTGEMRLPMVAGQLKDADWEQDITCDRCVAKDRVVHSRNGYRARPEGIGCIAMNARRPGPVWVKTGKARREQMFSA